MSEHTDTPDALASEVRKHDAAMTPGEWTHDRDSYNSEEHHTPTAKGSIVATADPKWPWYIATVENGPNPDEDAAGIAFFRNNASRIADALERGERYEKARQAWSIFDDPDEPRACRDIAHMALRAHLARPQETEGGES